MNMLNMYSFFFFLVDKEIEIQPCALFKICDL